ncbi:MAG: right-handed parallel beta-helix repeat-containing protein [Candidatus Pacearchaeota archaeon]|nr:right-handed parallel beta-helix repeat-containing protein [Candidatus Pacearchaeota archaeon]
MDFKRDASAGNGVTYGIAIVSVLIVAFGILLFAFQFAFNFEEIQFSPPANAVPLTACGILSTPDIYYTISGNGISFSGVSGEKCLHIIASNVTIDGNPTGAGVSGIIGSNTPGTLGILIEAENVSILGLTVDNFGNGIEIYNSNRTNISGSFIGQNLNIGINVSGNSSKNYIGENELTLNNLGIFLEKDSLDNKIYKNVIVGAIGSAGGIGLSESHENILEGNLIGGVVVGIALLSSEENDLINNGFQGDVGAIYIENTNRENRIEGGVILDTLGDAISLNSVSKVSIKNLNTANTNSFDINVLRNTGNVVLEDSYLPKYNFLPDGIVLRYKNSEDGEIAFLEKINGTGGNLSKDLRVEYNSAFVNSSLNKEFNKSANISFFGLSDFQNPEIKRDGETCPPDICIALGSLTEENVKFSVPSWSEYSIGEKDVVPALTVTEPDRNEVYYLDEFPVDFRARLNFQGKAWFSLNSGRNNKTMNTTDNRSFVYEQAELNKGNYTAVFFAKFINTSENNVLFKKWVNFSVVNSSLGNVGVVNTLIAGNTSGNTTVPITPPVTPPTGSTSIIDTPAEKGFEFRNVIYWIIMGILIILIVILVLLIVRHLRKKIEKPPMMLRRMPVENRLR